MAPVAVASADARKAQRRRIYVDQGFWWFDDPFGKGKVCLDPIFQKCGWKMGCLAKMLGIGERTLSRTIQESLGINGKSWLRVVRIVAARHLLRETDKIEPLAYYLGFSQHSDLTREFKKLVGVLPSEYIRSERLRS